jgi:hypothetical protein
LPRYRTEIEIPADRYVCIQLPAHMPKGRATVTVMFHDPESADAPPADTSDLDQDDIEWFDEFDEESDSSR